MQETILLIFGQGEELSVGQMSARAIFMFFIALALIRLSGRRSFGSRSPFDNIVVIMLGAILSRAVVGASPFVATVVAGIVICVIHRLLAIIAARNHRISTLIKGREGLIYKDGMLNTTNMKRYNLSMGDLLQGIRAKGNVSSLDEVREIWMERSGELSVIL